MSSMKILSQQQNSKNEDLPPHPLRKTHFLSKNVPLESATSLDAKQSRWEGGLSEQFGHGSGSGWEGGPFRADSDLVLGRCIRVGRGAIWRDLDLRWGGEQSGVIWT